MPSEFISEPITVETSEEMSFQPVSFIWRGTKYEIEKIINSWQDFSFGGSPTPRRAAFKQRRHRNYFRVITTTGEQFDMYYDRGGKKPAWILACRI